MQRYLICKFGKDLCRVTYIGSLGFKAVNRYDNVYNYGRFPKGIGVVDRGVIVPDGKPMTDDQFMAVMRERFPSVAFEIKYV